MKWVELTADEFREACKKTKGTCLIPVGVIEKHGAHLPLGTDVMVAEKVCYEVVKKEPAVVFPGLFFGQIAEARHVPGTISISPDIMFKLFDEVCSEISRNGFKKIVIVNTHGGNSHFIKYFIQSTLYRKKDYIVYNVIDIKNMYTKEQREKIAEVLGTCDFGEHAGNVESSKIMAIRPDLVKLNKVKKEQYTNQKRLEHLINTFTPVSWFAKYPEHHGGSPFKASKKAGEIAIRFMVENVAKQLKVIKEDTTAHRLLDEYFKMSENP